MMGDHVEGFIRGLIEQTREGKWIGNHFLLLKIEEIF